VINIEKRAADAIALYYQRVDLGEVAGILQLFSENAEYRRPGYEPIVGRRALRDFYLNQRVIRAGAHRITALVQSGADAAVQGTFVGTLRDGSSVNLEFADFFRFDGEAFSERVTYFFTALV
jgi:steroid delta-isomerase